MNKITVYFIFAIFIISSCTSLIGNSGNPGTIDWQNGEQILPGNEQQLNEEQRALYREDAEKLAIRYINQSDLTQTEIPQELIDLFYNGLIQIATSDHPEASEITHFGVHARIPKPRDILVHINSGSSWIDAWRNGTTETGNPEIDELIEQFDFTLEEYKELGNTSPSSTAVLRAGRAINVYAVGRLFEKLDDINSAGPDGVTDGNDISALFFDGYLRYKFEYGYGDCPSGCINRHNWYFNVHQDGTVEFVSEKGDPIPED